MNTSLPSLNAWSHTVSASERMNQSLHIYIAHQSTSSLSLLSPVLHCAAYRGVVKELTEERNTEINARSNGGRMARRLARHAICIEFQLALSLSIRC